MTVHSAKGLEFDNVFIVGLEEGIFPHSMSLYSPSEIEEERRLCYVAITRAKKNLTLINAKKRLLYGQDNYNPQSRFISEISDEYLDKEENTKKYLNPKIDIDVIEINDEDYNLGDKVIHKEFGEGVIITIDKSILTIAFPHPYGIKKIMKGRDLYGKKTRR